MEHGTSLFPTARLSRGKYRAHTLVLENLLILGRSLGLHHMGSGYFYALRESPMRAYFI